jgi:hypothetical protein
MKKLAYHKVLINAPIEVVWQTLLDWPNWSQWDKGMQSVRFDGPITLGSKGKLKVKTGVSGTLEIIEFIPEVSYLSRVKLLGSMFEFDHHIEPAAHLTLVTFRISAEGFVADALILYLMAAIGEQLPQWMNNLKVFIEKKRLDSAST